MLSAETPSTESPPQPPPIDDHFDEDEDLPDVPGEEDDEDEEDEDAGDGREPPHEFKEDTEKPVAESAEGEKRKGIKFTSSVCMMTVGIIMIHLYCIMTGKEEVVGIVERVCRKKVDLSLRAVLE